jgi:hypothetical protein
VAALGPTLRDGRAYHVCRSDLTGPFVRLIGPRCDNCDLVPHVPRDSPGRDRYRCGTRPYIGSIPLVAEVPEGATDARGQAQQPIR